ncbi:hypothetical protein G7046_g3763 [Stylonectria norvegica]|nr:hypothetical protein G7046_g3763 [Stylonectria norvegica]
MHREGRNRSNWLAKDAAIASRNVPKIDHVTIAFSQDPIVSYLKCYVQSLETRIAQLESLLPQERLDHLNLAELDEPPISPPPRNRMEVQRASHHSFTPGRASQGEDNPPRPSSSPMEFDTIHPIISQPVHNPSPLEFPSPGLVQAVSSMLDQLQPSVRDEASPRESLPSSELEQFLIQTYFDMAHCQYPMLLKHEVINWAYTWRSYGEDLPTEIKWQGFFVNMIYEDVDDDDLLAATEAGLPPIASRSPSKLSPALHIILSRQLESEIQEVALRNDFIPHSDEAFIWRAQMLKKLKEWRRDSTAVSQPSRKGYVSFGWLEMIYHYNIAILYRPTRTIIEGIAGDWSVQACCQALLLYRKFQTTREVAHPWLGLLTQFQMGVTLLYCFFATPPSNWKPSYRCADVPDAVRACSSTLAILADRWDEAECLRDVFEILAREVPIAETWGRPNRLSDAGSAYIHKHWQRMSTIVIHRPILRMIREMATETFAVSGDKTPVETRESSVAPAHEMAVGSLGYMDAQWADPSHTLSLGVGTPFDSVVDMETFGDRMDLYL